MSALASLQHSSTTGLACVTLLARSLVSRIFPSDAEWKKTGRGARRMSEPFPAADAPCGSPRGVAGRGAPRARKAWWYVCRTCAVVFPVVGLVQVVALSFF